MRSLNALGVLQFGGLNHCLKNFEGLPIYSPKSSFRGSKKSGFHKNIHSRLNHRGSDFNAGLSIRIYIFRLHVLHALCQGDYFRKKRIATREEWAAAASGMPARDWAPNRTRQNPVAPSLALAL
jgi:hypothetical protein